MRPGGGLHGCPRGVSRPRWTPAFEQRRSRPGCVRHAAPFCSTCGTSLQEARLERETRNSRGRTARGNPRYSGSPTRHGEPLAVRRPLEKHGPSGALRVSLGEWIVFVAPLDLLVFVIPLDVPRSISCAPDVRS